MIPLNLYHGTTEPRAKQIIENGFLDCGRRFDRWLASNGIYLVANRPSMALHFAERAIRSDRRLGARDRPMVLSVSVNWPDRGKVLDLTTDQGMSALYDACEQLYGHYRPSKPGAVECDELAALKADVRDREQALLELLAEAKSADECSLRKVNWTTVAIDLLVAVHDFAVVVAAIYEGQTFHQMFGTQMPKVSTVPEYEGIRVRDHIEVCVVDLSLIDMDQTSVYEIDSLRIRDDPFLKFVIV